MLFVFKEISAKTISLTTLSLLAYNNARLATDVDITKKGLERLKSIKIKVISGDEIAIVNYKDGRTETYDSSIVGGKRSHDEFDDEYVLYRDGDGESSVLMWLFRSDSYDRRWEKESPTYEILH